MNKNGKDEYKCINRQVKRECPFRMPTNLVHDMEYTFADEFYEELKNDYRAEYLEDNTEEN